MVTHRLGVITVPSEIRENFVVDTPYWPYDPSSIGPLNGLNVFIGPNNCGKSRFLRHCFASLLRKLEWLPGGSEWIRVYDHIIRTPPKMQDQYWPMAPGIRASRTTVAAVSELFVNYLEELTREKSRQVATSADWPARRWWRKTFGNGADYAGAEVPALPVIGWNPSEHVISYIPVLRGLRHPTRRDKLSVHDTIDDVFESRIKCDYNDIKGFEVDKRRVISTGLPLYREVAHRLLGTLEQRDSIAEFQKRLSPFFENQEVTLIPRHDSDVLYIKIGHETERPIYQLGDGLQHVVIIMSQLFFWRNKDLFLFIEEPELFLHPGLQRQLIDALIGEPVGDGASRQVFVTTHSHQFLDITLDTDAVTVFSFSKRLEEGQGRERHAVSTIRTRSSGELQVLAELGVRNSSVMLTNCTIWVEGITDRMYLRHYLKLFQESKASFARQFREDLHYSFVEYGGANLVHWSFLDSEGPRVDRLCGELMLICDRDSSAEGAKHKRFERLAQVLKDRFVPLQVREIENLLSPAVLRDVIRDYCGADVSIPECGPDAYRDAYLGDFIDRMLDAVSARTRVRKFAAPSGTLTDKVKFCEKAIAVMTAFDQLSPEAQALTRRIHEFIAAKNQA